MGCDVLLESSTASKRVLYFEISRVFDCTKKSHGILCMCLTVLDAQGEVTRNSLIANIKILED
jgi:hypothetical protein